MNVQYIKKLNKKVETRNIILYNCFVIIKFNNFKNIIETLIENAKK